MVLHARRGRQVPSWSDTRRPTERARKFSSAIEWSPASTTLERKRLRKQLVQLLFLFRRPAWLAGPRFALCQRLAVGGLRQGFLLIPAEILEVQLPFAVLGLLEEDAHCAAFRELAEQHLIGERL